MLEQKSMTRLYWAEEIQTAFCIRNWISTSGGKLTPHELYFRRKANWAHLKVFDSTAYVHILNERRKKLDAKAERVLLGGLLT